MLNMDLSRVMDAYRGQEDKLRKRVQLSNDLLELIAYEQLTREKRQLMAAKQAQAMPQGGLPTIRDQKEEEAFELTKQELAQQVGKTLQQQEAMRRQSMGRGLAAAPGAQNVMPQQAMAAGGIVAFNGETGSDVRVQPIPDRELLPMDANLEAKARREMAEMDSGQRVSLSPDVERFLARDVSGRQQRQAAAFAQQQQRAIESGRDVARQYAPRAPSQPVPQPTVDVDDPLKQATNVRFAPPRFVDILPPEASMPPRDREEAPPPQARDTGAAPSPNLRTPATVGTGIASALNAGMPQSNDKLMRDLEGTMRSSLLRSRQMRDEPQMEALARLRGEAEKIGAAFPTESPEAKRQAEAEQARLEQQYARLMDPEKQRLDNLIAFLAGGAGRRGIGSVLGGAAESANRARAANEAFGLQALKEMQAGRQAMRGRETAEQQAAFQARLKGLELGSKVAEVAAQIESQTGIADRKIDSELAAAALGALSRYGSDLNKIQAEVQTRAAQLGYEISRDDLNRIAQITVAQIGAGGRESQSIDQEISRLTIERSRIQDRINDNIRNRRRDDMALNQALNTAPGKRNAAQQQLVNTFEEEMAGERGELQNIDRRVAELRTRLGSSATAAPARSGSAASQGVTVTGATAPR